MRASRWLMVALFGISAVLVVEAQQPGRGRGGFGQINTTNAVLNNKDLQAELKITDTQKEKFKDVIDKQTELNKKRGEMFKGGKGSFDKEKFAEITKESEALNADIKKVVEATLTPEQLKRLHQIDMQAKGIRAFSNEEIAKDLNLTEAQKSKVKGIVDDYDKDAKELFGGRGKGGGGGFDKEKAAENQKKREKLTKAATADIEDTLTADQKAKWKSLTGEPFDVDKLRQGFGGFGGFGRNKNKTKD
jgi:Spy/CpxP family protein refolding chaperone